MRKEADLYKKVVYWSDEDQCFIGMCPELMSGGVHGDDSLEVFVELNQAADEVIQIIKESGKPLPEPQKIFTCETA
jgi:predicted RNase H-like HicB family nuclease